MTYVGPTTHAQDPRVEAVLDWSSRHREPLTVLGVCVAEDPLVGDALTALGSRPGRPRVEATFIEDDAASAAVATTRLRKVPGAGVTIVHGDPGSSDSYGAAAPVDLVLFGPAIIDGRTTRRRGLAEALPALLVLRGHLAWWGDRIEHLDGWHRALAAAGLVTVTVGPTWGLAGLVASPRRLQDGQRFYPAGLTG